MCSLVPIHHGVHRVLQHGMLFCFYLLPALLSLSPLLNLPPALGLGRKRGRSAVGAVDNLKTQVTQRVGQCTYHFGLALECMLTFIRNKWDASGNWDHLRQKS
jgi:hypothetical protein